jgi:thiamine kinase-like enzyme
MKGILQYFRVIVLTISSSFGEPANDPLETKHLPPLSISVGEKRSVCLAPVTPIDEKLGEIPKTHKFLVHQAIDSVFPDYKTFEVKKMVGGLSIASLFELTIDDKRYVLRLLSPDKSHYKRKSEAKAHQKATELGIAPQLHYIDDVEDPFVIIMDYIEEARTLTRYDLNNGKLMCELMTTLRKFHNISDIDLHTQSRMNSLDKTYKAYSESGKVSYPSCYSDLLTKLKKDFDSVHTLLTPIHGDLSPRNVLLTNDGKIFLIDFAEAHLGDFFVDFGWFSCVTEADPIQIDFLLKAYLQREPTTAEIKKVLFFKNFSYFFLSNSWLRRQNERDPNTLDLLLASPSIPPASDYIHKDITPEDILSSGDQLSITKYSLGFLKEYLNSLAHKNKGKEEVF